MGQSFQIVQGALFPALTLKCEQRDENGDWQAILGLTGATVKFTMIEPVATINADSDAAQKIVYVDDTWDFVATDKIVIGRGTKRREDRIVASVQDGVSITLTTDLDYDHTFDQGDAVHIVRIDDEDGEVYDDVKALVRYNWAAGDTIWTPKLYSAKFHITMLTGQPLSVPVRDEDELFVEIMKDV